MHVCAYEGQISLVCSEFGCKLPAKILFAGNTCTHEDDICLKETVGVIHIHEKCGMYTCKDDIYSKGIIGVCVDAAVCVCC